jgi:Bifunctional DNA primase/polymerase, N-terminal
MSGRMGERERAAHRYAEVGWPVFPCAPRSKMPLFPAAHPRSRERCTGECGEVGHGLHDATTDHRTIRRWWRDAPAANVAIATGAPGPDVLDIDVKPAGSGFPSLGKLVRAELVPPPQARVRTPSGGGHLYYRGTEQGNGSLSKSHVDYRGRGGYVLAPPSSVNGRPYELLDHGPSAETFDWAAARECLEPAPVRPARQVRPDGADADGLVTWVRDCNEGINARLFWAACRAAEQGRDDLFPALAQAAYDAGEDRRGQAERTIASAIRNAGRPPFERAVDREAGQ